MRQQKIREELKECSALMADLFQSGLTVVQKPVMERLDRESVTVRQYGLSRLADRLTELGERLEERRHEVSRKQDAELCGLFVEINRYLELAITQADFDEAGERLGQGKTRKESL